MTRSRTPPGTYSRIRERRADVRLVRNHLLGRPDVKSYDGSGTGWGDLLGAPSERSPAA